MKLRDFFILSLIFSGSMLLGIYFINETSTFQREYLVSASGTNKYSLIVLDVPAEHIKIYVVPDGTVNISISRFSLNERTVTLFNQLISKNVILEYNLDQTTYLKIFSGLNPGERVLITIEVSGKRNDIIVMGIEMLVGSIAFYLLLTIISYRFNLDWI